MVVADARVNQSLRGELLARVASLKDRLAADIPESLAGRTLAPASVAALREAGIFALKLPRELGGREPDPMTQVEVIEAVSYIDASLGWTVCIGNGAISLTGFFPDEAIATMFKGGRIPTMAGVFKPVRGVAVPGGVRVSGRWSWGSGIRHAEWVAAHVLVDAAAGQPPLSRIVAMPIEDVTIHDNWHVSGLSSTGSCDFSVDNLFIADAFMFDLRKLEPRRGGPFFRMGLPGLLINEFMALYFGVARRVLDEMVALIAPKQRGYGKPSSVVERGVVQRAIGAGDMKLRAARALAMEILEQAWATVCRGEAPSVAQQVDMRAVTVLAAETAVEIAAKALRYSGGQAIFLDHILQRSLRDLEAAAAHLLVSDVAYEHRGQLLLGLPAPDPMGA